MTYEELLNIASTEDVEITEISLPDNLEGMYFNNHIRINKDIGNLTGKACILAEELGHYFTSMGDITNQSVTSNRKQELQARLWAYNKQVGLLGIVQAYENRCRDLHEMADFLDVTETFLSDALVFYQSKYGVSVEIDNYIIRFIPNLQITKLL